MSRGLATILIGGCALVLAIDLPVVVASVSQDLDGPYPAWTSISTQAVVFDDTGTAPTDASRVVEARASTVEDAAVAVAARRVATDVAPPSADDVEPLEPELLIAGLPE